MDDLFIYIYVWVFDDLLLIMDPLIFVLLFLFNWLLCFVELMKIDHIDAMILSGLWLIHWMLTLGIVVNCFQIVRSNLWWSNRRESLVWSSAFYASRVEIKSSNQLSGSVARVGFVDQRGTPDRVNLPCVNC